MSQSAQSTLENHIIFTGTAHAVGGVERISAGILIKSETDFTGCVKIWEEKETSGFSADPV